jgi:hypothetical protein
VVLWPQYFNIHDVPATEFVSERLGVLASAVHTYDGDYWVHTLIRNGEQLDRFASMPGYHLEDSTELPAFERAWAGNPQLVAETMGRAADQVAPYFVHVPADSDAELGKAFDDDEFDRGDIWVFVDLWRRLGITYPDVTTAVASLRLAPDWFDKLPTGNESDL